MTTEALIVEQCDRKAAADLLDEISSLLDHVGIGQVADLVRDGEYDEHEAPIAFARHRTLSRALPDREIIQALRDALKPFAEQQTIDEVMRDPDPPAWVEATIERRLEMMAERKRKNDADILNARQSLAKADAILEMIGAGK